MIVNVKTYVPSVMARHSSFRQYSPVGWIIWNPVCILPILIVVTLLSLSGSAFGGFPLTGNAALHEWQQVRLLLDLDGSQQNLSSMHLPCKRLNFGVFFSFLFFLSLLPLLPLLPVPSFFSFSFLFLPP